MMPRFNELQLLWALSGWIRPRAKLTAFLTVPIEGFD